MDGTSARETVEIDLALCETHLAARTIDTDAVAALAESIAEIGLLQPITVRRAKARRGRGLSDVFEVLAGMHRVKAFRRLQRTTIPAFVVEVDDLRAELMLIDENLRRNELSPAGRARAMARRKAIYLDLHPETRHGQNQHTRSGQLGHSTKDVDGRDTPGHDGAAAAPRFTAETAQTTGAGERTVRRDVKRGEALGDAVLARVERTSLDKGEELDALAKLPADRREDLIARAEAGEKVTAKTEAQALPGGSRTIMASRREPEGGPDYAPTPPWATRALFEHVFAHMDVRPKQAWDPACGEGHMTAVLAEYVPPGSVIGTDIFDYGRDGRAATGWLRQQDFLDEAAETPTADWIVTNPPFGEGRAEAFALRALGLARLGVAMFLRSQWLEGVERYGRIFAPHPPALIAQFAERVPLHMGRWEPDGSTATAYCWVVWLTWRTVAETAFTWIPPGRREALTRSDDRARFTARPVVGAPGPAAATAKPADPALTAAPSGPAQIPTEDIPTFLRRGHADCKLGASAA